MLNHACTLIVNPRSGEGGGGCWKRGVASLRDGSTPLV